MPSSDAAANQVAAEEAEPGNANSAVAAPPKKRKLRNRPEVAQSTGASDNSSVSGAASGYSNVEHHPSSTKAPKMEIPENPVDKLQAVKKRLNQRLQRLVPVQPKGQWMQATC